jgi:hypothetical protein
MPANPKHPTESGLIVRSGGALAKLPDGGTHALAEIINRSLVHIQTSKALAVRHRIGEHDLCGPDYRLVCAFAEDVGMTPEEVLRRLLLPKSGYLFPDTRIEDGRFKELLIDEETLPFSSIPSIEGLVVEILRLGLKAAPSGLVFSMFPHLTVLDCCGNQLTELDLSNVTDLTKLDCDQNQLNELNLAQVPNLTTLLCSDNKLTDLDLSVVTNLTVLNCSKNQITELDLSQVPNLTTLLCSDNQLAELDLSEVPNLTMLSCYNNQLAELDLSQVSNLATLWCDGNQLAELDLSQVPNLTHLCCYDNELTELDLSKVPNLTLLRCENNQLSELDLRMIRNLETLEYDPGTRLVQRPDQNF